MAFVPIMAAYLLLLVRLCYVQGHLGNELLGIAEKRRATSIVIPPRRGTILDRNDHPLAVSVYSGTLCFDPVPLVSETDKKQVAVNQLHLERSIVMVAGCRRIAGRYRTLDCCASRSRSDQPSEITQNDLM